jgi:stringent starvation protein B
MATQPTSRRPYLLRAMHEWITDNGLTPHLVVDAQVDGVAVPRQYVRDGKIVLNVSHAATASLVLGNEVIGFSARFSGAPFEVRLPVGSVVGIYARETGQGMIFSEGERDPPPSVPPAPRQGGGGEAARRPRLKVVK